MWIWRWLFWTEVFFWGSIAPKEKYLGPKQSPRNSYNDRKIDGAKLLLSLITTLYTFLMHFMKKYFIKLISHALNSYLSERILFSPGVNIIAKCDKHTCVWCNACAGLAFYREKHSALMTSHTGIIMRSHCALIMSRVVTCIKWKNNLLDWIMLLHRLLIGCSTWVGNTWHEYWSTLFEIHTHVEDFEKVLHWVRYIKTILFLNRCVNTNNLRYVSLKSEQF